MGIIKKTMKKTDPLKKEIESLKKSYGHLANLMIENKKLVMRNIATNALMTFPDGKSFRQLSNGEVVKVSQLL